MKKTGESGNMDSVGRFPTHLNLLREHVPLKPGGAQSPLEAEDAGEQYHKTPISSAIGKIYSPDLFPEKQEKGFKAELLYSTVLRRVATAGLAALSLFGAIAAQSSYVQSPGFVSPQVTTERVLDAELPGQSPDAPAQSSASGANAQKSTERAQEVTEKTYDSTRGTAIADSARAVAKKMNREGKCYRGVKRALSKHGILLTGRYARLGAAQLERIPGMKEIKIGSDELEDLEPGSVVVWSKCKGHPFGHASIALGDGTEASDHIQEQITYLGKGGTFRVFIPVK